MGFYSPVTGSGHGSEKIIYCREINVFACGNILGFDVGQELLEYSGMISDGSSGNAPAFTVLPKLIPYPDKISIAK